MPRKKITFDTVRKIALGLAGVEESTTYRSPSLKVRGKLLACIPVHRSAEPDSLAVRIDFHEREALIEADPDTYYVTNHYVDYPVVLVRLSHIKVDELENLLGTGWRFVTSKARQGKRTAVKQEGLWR